MVLSEIPKWKIKKKSAGLAEPSEYTGGTHLRVPPDPWSLILEYPENTLAEPMWGIRQFRQTWKTRQNVYLTRKTISEFFENS